MAVARVPKPERQLGQVRAIRCQSLQRRPQAKLVAIRVEGRAGDAPEDTAEARPRGAHGPRQLGERQFEWSASSIAARE